MIPHETLAIFSLLWWQSNIVTLSLILFFLLLGKWFNLEDRNNLAIVIGAVLIFRTVGVHFYWNYLGIWTIETSLPLHLCGLSAILSGIVLLAETMGVWMPFFLGNTRCVSFPYDSGVYQWNKWASFLWILSLTWRHYSLCHISHVDTGDETPKRLLVEGIPMEPTPASSNWINKLDIKCKLYVSLYQANS